jgi:hypothetical protein
MATFENSISVNEIRNQIRKLTEVQIMVSDNNDAFGHISMAINDLKVRINQMTNQKIYNVTI